MRKLLGIVGALLLLTSPLRAADSTVSAMSAASALAGTELMYCVQSGGDTKCTPAQIATYVQSLVLAKGGGGTGATTGAAASSNLSLIYSICSGEGTSFTGSTGADKIIAQCTIPAGTIGAHGRVVFAGMPTRNSSGTSNVVFKMFISATNDGVGNNTTGTQVGPASTSLSTTQFSGNVAGWFINAGLANAQVFNNSSFGLSGSATTRSTMAVDTAVNPIYVQWTANLGTAGDSGNLDGFYVEIIPAGGN